jgi:hypothetical protein
MWNYARHPWSFTQTAALHTFPTVPGNVTAKSFHAFEWSVTIITDEWTLFIMNDLMVVKTTLITKQITTHTTYVRMLYSMYMHVRCQVMLPTKTFTTQITGIWIVIIMPVYMFFQSLLVTERHITHITVIRSLHSMHDFTNVQIFFSGTWFFKHHM